MQFFRFAEQLPRFSSQSWFRCYDHAKKVFRFLRFFCTSPDHITEIFPRNALIGLAIISANARTAADELIN